MPYFLTAHGPPDAYTDGPELYENALGGAATVREHWIAPARRLGLPILARLATEDVTVRHTDLDTLAAEVVRLSQDWTDSVPGDATTLHLIDGRRFEVPLLVDLLHRADHLTAAIRLARLAGGHVWMGSI
ncbi:hypothetical protein [Spongiactinospora rosea]|uniref:hypothetical protein n=1 Tax=Spongiactinospora rosea TaxID=2248750 RepID=UPI001313F7EA|nr:hypothetical protein [Spongiactinospora rosea]